MTQVDLQLFGYPEIRIDGQLVALPLRRSLAALAYLAEAKTPISRDVLAALLWPDADEATGRTRLRRMLHHLQLKLSTRIIAGSRTALQFEPLLALCLDTRLFEQACAKGDFAEAGRLYRADFLAGFSLDGCSEFEEWAFFRREALRSRLVHALERLIEEKRLAGDYRELVIHATRFLTLDPLSETAHRHLIAGHRLAGDAAAARRQYESCERLLKNELGVAPDPATRAVLDVPAGPVKIEGGRISYAVSDGLHLAFQVVGEGPTDFIWLPGFVTHLERLWDEPCCKNFMIALSRMGRLIVFDRRGIGLSDRVGGQPTVDATAQDIGAVMTAAGSRKAVLIGGSEGAPSCIAFAAASPQRLRGLILCGALAKGCWAPDYPFALTKAQYDVWLERLVRQWGGPAEIKTFAPSLVGDRLAEAWWAGLLRSASSPGAVKGVLEAMRDMDVRQLLPQVGVRTLVLHRTGDRAVRIEAGRHVATAIPDAHFVELSGEDHWMWAGDQTRIVQEIRRFVQML